MPLNKQDMEIRFGQGLDQGTDPKQTAKLLLLENAQFDKAGMLSKREGFYPKTTVIATPNGKAKDTEKAILSTGNQLLQVIDIKGGSGFAKDDHGALLSYDNGESKWNRAGYYRPWQLDVIPSITEDARMCNGLDGCLWTDDYYSVVVGIYDHSTASESSKLITINRNENTIVSEYNLSTGGNGLEDPVVYNLVNVSGTDIITVLGAVLSTNSIYMFRLGGNPYSESGYTQIINDLSPGDLWDSCFIDHPTYGDCVVIAYENTIGDLTIKTFDSTATLKQTINTGQRADECVGVWIAHTEVTGNDYIWAGWRDDGSNNIVREAYRPDTGAVYMAKATVRTINVGDTLIHITGSNHKAFYNIGNVDEHACFFTILQNRASPPPDNYETWYYRLHYHGTITAGACMYNTRLIGKPCQWKDKAYVLVKPVTPDNHASNQGGYFLCTPTFDAELTASFSDQAWATMGKAFYLYGNCLDFHNMAKIDLSSDGEFYVPAVSNGAGIDLSLSALREDSVSVLKWSLNDIFTPHANLSEDTLLGGPFVGHYDGKFNELGFHLYPDIIRSTDAGGTILSDGVYYYRACYEYVDNNGQIHRSAPSTQWTHTVSGGPKDVSVWVSTLPFGDPLRLDTQVKVRLYRTPSGGGVFRLIDEWTTNVIDSYYVSITDSTTDAELASREALYTTGGVLELYAPPPAKDICSSENRIFLISSDDPYCIWYSHEKSYGYAPQFASYNTLRIDADGPNHCISYMDGKVLIFKEKCIYYFTGQGPGVTGTGGSFTQARVISNAVGCTNPASIVKFPGGIIFQAAGNKGLWLLDRQMNCQYIGKDIEDYSGYTVTSAVFDQSNDQVKITLSGQKVILVYNYLTGQWATFIPANIPIHACQYGEYYTYLNTGINIQDNTNTYRDESIAISMKLRTSWIKPSGLLSGYHRIWWVYLLGDYKSPHTLTIKVYYDYDDITAVETKTVTPSNNPYLYRFMPAKQRCRAIMFEIYDTPSASGTREGLSLSGIKLVCAVKKPKITLGSSRTM